MRRILDRYIFAELLPPFFLSLGALCFIMLTKELLLLVELLVAQGVGIVAVLKVFAYLFPSFLVLTLPIAAIIASVSAFSRLSFDKEIVAMSTAGLSLFRISRPVLLFSCLVFSLTVVLSQWGQPWTNISLKKLALNVLKDHLTLALKPGVFNEPVPSMVVYVGKGDSSDPEQKKNGIFISDMRDPQEPQLIIAADYQVMNDPTQHRVALRLLDGTVHSRPYDLDQYHQVTFSTYDLKVTLPPGMYSKTQERPSRSSMLRRLEETQGKDTWALRRLMESYRDLAFPSAALLLGMIGVPIGIVSKRSGQIGGFAIGVTVVILYYILNVLCDFFVVTRVLQPFAGAWLPNFLFLLLGGWLYYHVGRR